MNEETVEEKVDDSWTSIMVVLLARQRGSDASTSLEGIVQTLCFLVFEIANGIQRFLMKSWTIKYTYKTAVVFIVTIQQCWQIGFVMIACVL